MSSVGKKICCMQLARHCSCCDLHCSAIPHYVKLPAHDAAIFIFLPGKRDTVSDISTLKTAVSNAQERMLVICLRVRIQSQNSRREYATLQARRRQCPTFESLASVIASDWCSASCRRRRSKCDCACKNAPQPWSNMSGNPSEAQQASKGAKSTLTRSAL